MEGYDRMSLDVLQMIIPVWFHQTIGHSPKTPLDHPNDPSKLQTGPDMYWLKQWDTSGTAGSEVHGGVIEKHPEFWDRSSEKYKGAKRDAWPQIVTALFPEWPNLPKQGQAMIMGDVKKRWRSVTDIFMKSLKSPSGSSPPMKRVPYADQLQFILGSRSLRRTESNVCAQTPPDLNEGDTTVDNIGEEVQDSRMASQDSLGEHVFVTRNN
ncbi:unnamed protein product [Ranitomeya imitator]|uniref:MADF domain-containing protein n=1 Tax=Ranitomeya imitator TaxID=111125 RepID=A0ABN9LFR0_9NEOB|nr:unnamed protein product [Ranitomeya imitator]